MQIFGQHFSQIEKFCKSSEKQTKMILINVVFDNVFFRKQNLVAVLFGV